MSNTLAERIRFIINEQKIKQIVFAKALGVSANYVTLLVTGRKTAISVILAKLIESTYGYRTEWLLNGELPIKADTVTNLKQETINLILKLDESKIEEVLGFVNSLDANKE